MNPVRKALLAAFVRWLMVFVGAHGVEFGDHDREQLVDALLVIIPLIWSAYHKWDTHETIEDAKAGLL